VEVALHPPKSSIRRRLHSGRSAGRHKKQTGGRGQFGDASHIRTLARGEGLCSKKIFGGSVPQQFSSAIEKGIIEAASNGAVAGYPLSISRPYWLTVLIILLTRRTFVPGSRPQGLRAAIDKVSRPPGPIMDVEVMSPQEYSGDIMGDLNSREGRVQGMEMRGNQQMIKAQVPMSEMLNYQSTLNLDYSSRGSYHMQFSHYDPVPGRSRQKSSNRPRSERPNPR